MHFAYFLQTSLIIKLKQYLKNQRINYFLLSFYLSRQSSWLFYKKYKFLYIWFHVTWELCLCLCITSLNSNKRNLNLMLWNVVRFLIYLLVLTSSYVLFLLKKLIKFRIQDLIFIVVCTTVVIIVSIFENNCFSISCNKFDFLDSSDWFYFLNLLKDNFQK